MIKVITYGTFDMFHIGHQRLLERAKALGDYLIVGVTSEDFDKARGKLPERVLQSSLFRSHAGSVQFTETYRVTRIEDGYY